MTAMMVMSNIESFARTLETRSDRMAPTDSIAAWFLCTPYEDLELLPEKELADLISRATDFATLNHDHSAENIFSNSIDTWKNVANVQFIDNVGSCFSAINGVEEQFNQWVMEVPEALRDIQVNPDNYEEKGEDVGTPPNAQSFYTNAYTLDSLTSLTHLTDRIEELKAEKE